MALNKTLIDWVKNPDGTQGYTWNPITGCNNQIGGMCQGGSFPCYAYRLANGRLRDRYLANKNTATRNYDEDSYPFYPRFWEERYLDFTTKRIRHHNRGRRGIFVCDMSDLFGLGIPEQWTRKVLEATAYFPRDRFYLLTKQPQNLIKWSPFPDNCWVGVTATDQEKLYWAVEELVQIKAKVKYLSLEPLLEWVSPTGWLIKGLSHFLKWGGINQVIIGAQTNPYKPPKIEWVQEIVEACDKAKLPIFMKDNLRPIWYNYLRQEMPVEDNYANHRRDPTRL